LGGPRANFLFAGASNVIATLWPVEDRSTSEFMVLFHRRFAETNEPGETLVETQRAVARNPRTAHPFYWAGFVLVRGN
jgi:CHAT domain-containing protein